MEDDTQLALKDQFKWKSGEKNQTDEVMEFGKFSVGARVLYSEHDNLNSIRNYHFDVDPRVSFDDWVPIQ